MPDKQTSLYDKTPTWHSDPSQQVLETLKTAHAGLSQAEAQLRFELCGANRLQPQKPKSIVIRFLLQFHNVLIYILLAASEMTAFLGCWVDSGVIFGVVVINAIIGFVQESRAEKALNALSACCRSTRSFCAGQRMQIATEQLVPGDIVLLQSGDKVPVDLRLLSCKSLRIEEAALTGESAAVEKSIHTVNAVNGNQRPVLHGVFGHAGGLCSGGGHGGCPGQCKPNNTHWNFQISKWDLHCLDGWELLIRRAKDHCCGATMSCGRYLRQNDYR